MAKSDVFNMASVQHLEFKRFSY